MFPFCIITCWRWRLGDLPRVFPAVLGRQVIIITTVLGASDKGTWIDLSYSPKH
jgi:hypothetical protein